MGGILVFVEMNVITALSVHLPKVLVKIVVDLILEPTLLSHGINFDDKDSRENGVTIAAKYALAYICEYESHEKVDFSHSLNFEIWDAIVGCVEGMRRDKSLTGFRLNVECKVEVVDEDVIILGQAIDPTKDLLERIKDNKHGQCVGCKERLPLEGTTLCSACIPTDYIFPMDKELKRRVRCARLSMELHHVSEKIESWVKTESGDRYRFRFDRTYYAFSNQKEKSKKIRDEIESLFSQAEKEDSGW